MATSTSHPHPYLFFCPYLPMTSPVTFADWDLGPLDSFEDRWGNHQFRDRAMAFLRHFVGPNSRPIDNPALLCKTGQGLDGQEPSDDEAKALELALAFAFLDRNPRCLPENQHTWGTVTAENAELQIWPIPLDEESITKSTGLLVTVQALSHTDDPGFVMSPPLDLTLPMGIRDPDPLVLGGIYKTTLKSLRSPGRNDTTDKVRVAVEWLAKAWHNTVTVRYPERIVFLKTAFEAITGTSKTHKSAKELRKILEQSPANAHDSKVLIWSPEEQPIHTHTWVDRAKVRHTCLVTDLEHWFMEFGTARNTIIHEGKLPQLEYSRLDTAYSGHFFYTAEFLLRGVIKILLSNCGYEDIWLSELQRTIRAAFAKAESAQNA